MLRAWFQGTYSAEGFMPLTQGPRTGAVGIRNINGAKASQLDSKEPSFSGFNFPNMSKA